MLLFNVIAADGVFEFPCPECIVGGSELSSYSSIRLHAKCTNAIVKLIQYVI